MENAQNHHKPFLRAAMVFYSAGLAVLWLISISTARATWFSWVDLIGASLALYAAMVMTYLPLGAAVASGVFFSLGIITLWIVGLATGVADWLAWVSFGMSVLLLLGTLVTAGRGIVGRRTALERG